MAILFFITTNLYTRLDSAYTCATAGTGRACGRKVLGTIFFQDGLYRY